MATTNSTFRIMIRGKKDGLGLGTGGGAGGANFGGGGTATLGIGGTAGAEGNLKPGASPAGFCVIPPEMIRVYSLGPP
jgi:hypothetical protein